MAKELILRKGTTAEHSTFTGKLAEVTVDTTKKTLVVHDGVTTGGILLAKELETQDALDLKVGISGDQTITGIITFNVSPVVPAPSSDFEAANKQYVDTFMVTAKYGLGIKIDSRLTPDAINTVGIYIEDPMPGTTIYWGDGASSNVTTSGMYTYGGYSANPGIYTINIEGGGTVKLGRNLDNSSFANAYHILEVYIGYFKFRSLTETFKNVKSSFKVFGTPNLENLTNYSMYQTFWGCAGFNYPLNWDTANITSMVEVFYNCTSLNSTINFNTSNCISLKGMFNSCVKFNKSLEHFNVSSCENFSEMFNNCRAFNQPLNSWNVSNAINMYGMFGFAASVFNQPLNSWDVSNVTDMSRMFYGANVFNQNISNWNTSSVVSCTNFRRSSLSCENTPPLPSSCTGC